MGGGGREIARFFRFFDRCERQCRATRRSARRVVRHSLRHCLRSVRGELIRNEEIRSSHLETVMIYDVIRERRLKNFVLSQKNSNLEFHISSNNKSVSFSNGLLL